MKQSFIIILSILLLSCATPTPTTPKQSRSVSIALPEEPAFNYFLSDILYQHHNKVLALKDDYSYLSTTQFTTIINDPSLPINGESLIQSKKISKTLGKDFVVQLLNKFVSSMDFSSFIKVDSWSKRNIITASVSTDKKTQTSSNATFIFKIKAIQIGVIGDGFVKVDLSYKPTPGIDDHLSFVINTIEIQRPRGRIQFMAIPEVTFNSDKFLNSLENFKYYNYIDAPSNPYEALSIDSINLVKLNLSKKNNSIKTMFSSKQQNYLRAINKKALQIWNSPRADLGKGDTICSYDNKVGFIEDTSTSKVKVHWQKRVNDAIDGFWFGKTPLLNMSNSEYGVYNYTLVNIDEITWTFKDKVQKCGVDI
jgi:hypothetical protein